MGKNEIIAEKNISLPSKTSPVSNSTNATKDDIKIDKTVDLTQSLEKLSDSEEMKPEKSTILEGNNIESKLEDNILKLEDGEPNQDTKEVIKKVNDKKNE